MNIDIALSRLKLFRQLKENKFQMLTFGVYKNVLRIYVREGSGVAGEKTKLLQNLPLMLMNARIFVEELKKLSTRESGYNFVMELYAPGWTNEKMDRSKKDLQGKIGMARAKSPDGDTTNLIYVVSNQNVKAVFPLIPTPYIQFSVNGKKITDKEVLSNMWTDGYAKTLDDALSLFPEIHVVDKDVKQDYGKKNNGGSDKNSDMEILDGI